ncbi:MAG: DUF499 domain-containing protein [Bacteroidales bacterium]
MAYQPWTPWHKVISLRPDLRSGELSLATFAADLYDVAMQRGSRPIYEDPAEFFALTYPTYNLRELARDVVLRLAGKNDKAVRQLALTYGGGKTHTLITLFHLVNDPECLPRDLPAVKEFLSEIGIPLPKARIAALTFDKLDVEKGMEVRSPSGNIRWLKHPWSVLAYQIAGEDGLRLLHAEGLDAERESAPAENLLTDLLAFPQKGGLSTLILLDEVLMFAREKIGLAPAWHDRLVNFFQYLTQAVTHVDHACLVASLLATDPRKSDSLGKQITQELEAIFARQREESIQPVVKEDVAEVLRRRLFTPDSIRDREAFRPHVVAALKGIEALDHQTQVEGKVAEDRFVRSYPFHPDLTEVFYSKWTNLEGFQRTRGVLRTFALALREAEKWDTAPLVSTNTFLSEPGSLAISEAARELAQIATAEEYEGKQQQWSQILQSELNKAAEIQREYPAVQGREIEQAVMATFLHSQPIGQRLQTRELFLLVGATRPDKIELEKSLLRWAALSWFLDDTLAQDTDKSSDGASLLPNAWRLGSRPNLTQMHHDACRFRVPAEVIEARLIDEIGKLKSLTAGASGQGVKVHNLPEWPKQVEDDGDFHFVILGPKSACAAGNPSSEAKRFIDETTASDRPRVYRNAIVLAAPSIDGLDAARNAIMKYLGWEEVRTQLKDQQVDPIREALLSTNLEGARRTIPDSIRQAYCVVIAVDERNRMQAYRITPSIDPLFAVIKRDIRVRIQETSVSADALLPGGPYDLWREGDTARRLKDLVTAFAQFSHLPKMLNKQAILDTLVDGCRQGLFVLRLVRPDKTFRTFWRQTPDEMALKEPAMEVVLPEVATLNELVPELLVQSTLPGLWSSGEIRVKQVTEYFSGSHVVQIQKEGYEEPLNIPGAEEEIVHVAIGEAVKRGLLWLVSGPASIYAEDIPAGLLMADSTLLPPPAKISTMDVLPDRLPEAWKGETTSALAITAALSSKTGKSLPWKLVRDGLDGAFKAHYLERTLDSKPWPCDYGDAQWIKVRIPNATPLPHPLPQPTPPVNAFVAEAALMPNQIQDLAEVIGGLLGTAVGFELKFSIRVEADRKMPFDVLEKINHQLGEVDVKLRLR